MASQLGLFADAEEPRAVVPGRHERLDAEARALSALTGETYLTMRDLGERLYPGADLAPVARWKRTQRLVETVERRLGRTLMVRWRGLRFFPVSAFEELRNDGIVAAGQHQQESAAARIDRLERELASALERLARLERLATAAGLH